MGKISWGRLLKILQDALMKGSLLGKEAPISKEDQAQNAEKRVLFSIIMNRFIILRRIKARRRDQTNRKRTIT